MIEDCGNFKWRYAIVLSDPHLHDFVEGELLCTIPYGSLSILEDSLIVKTYAGPYLFELLYLLKGKGVRAISVLDLGTSLVGRLSIGTFLPVFTSTSFPQQSESVILPMVPDFDLFIESLKQMEKRGMQPNKLAALSTYLPLVELSSNIEEFKAMEIDVIDRVSAYIYKLCKGKLRCVVFDVIDSNLPKGIQRETVHDKSSKYYELLAESIKESVEILKALGEKIQ